MAAEEAQMYVGNPHTLNPNSVGMVDGSTGAVHNPVITQNGALIMDGAAPFYVNQPNSYGQAASMHPQYYGNNMPYVTGVDQVVDPMQMQAMAFNQSQMYAPFGNPYMGPGMQPMMYPGAVLPMATSFYAGLTPLAAPSYHDPYGMLNPAACVAQPSGSASSGASPCSSACSNGQSQQNGGINKNKKKKEKKCFGCC